MRIKVLSIWTGAYGMFSTKRKLENVEMRGHIEIIQSISLLRSNRIMRSVLEIWGNFLSIILPWKTPSNAEIKIKNWKESNNNNNQFGYLKMFWRHVEAFYHFKFTGKEQNSKVMEWTHNNDYDKIMIISIPPNSDKDTRLNIWNWKRELVI